MSAGFGHVRVADTGLSLSRLGFGCARLFGKSEMRASGRLIEAALASGIRHFDTAPSYAWGQSEQVLGEVLAGVPDVTITTKVGLPWASGEASYAGTIYRRIIRPLLGRTPGLKRSLLRVAAHRAAPSAPTSLHQPILLARDEIRRSLEGSLVRLRRDSVDVLLVHEPDRLVLNDDMREVFADLEGQRLIGAHGLGWGRVVSSYPKFGQVVQSRYDPKTVSVGDATRIYHGVVRVFSDDAPADWTKMSAVIRIQHVLSSSPISAVIFSASSPAQIRDIARSLAHAS